MRIRILSAAVGIVFAVVALMFNKSFPILINILVAVFSLLCTTELLNAKGQMRNLKISVPCMLFAALCPMLIGLWPVFMYFLALMLFSMMIFFHEKVEYKTIAFLFTAIVVATGGMTSIIALCDADRGHTGFYVTMCLIIPWVADGGAYFVGSFMGKRKLCPKISPKKTVEGAVGGVIIGIIGALTDAFVFQTWIFPGTEQINYINVFILALFGTLISIVGDLSFSLIKRSCHVKDYGHAIPGHGGILDRFDSVIFTAPFVYFFVQYFPIMTM